MRIDEGAAAVVLIVTRLPLSRGPEWAAIRTLRNIKRLPRTFTMLVCWFCYSDGFSVISSLGALFANSETDWGCFPKTLGALSAWLRSAARPCPMMGRHTHTRSRRRQASASSSWRYPSAQRSAASSSTASPRRVDGGQSRSSFRSSARTLRSASTRSWGSLRTLASSTVRFVRGSELVACRLPSVPALAACPRRLRLPQ